MIPTLRRKWAIDYQRDESGAFRARCPYCQWTETTSTLSDALRAAGWHVMNCEGTE